MTRFERHLHDDPEEYFQSRRTHWMKWFFVDHSEYLLRKIFNEVWKEKEEDSRGF